MPLPIQPALGEQPSAPVDEPSASSSGAGGYSNLAWLAQNPIRTQEADFQTGNYAPGHILGGPSQDNVALLQDPRKYAIYKPPPPLTDAAPTAQKAFGKWGTVTLDMIDPFTTMDSAMQGGGVSQQGSNDVVNKVGGFFAEKDINTGNAPVRMFDYGTALLTSIFDEAQGKPIVAPRPTSAGEIKYGFQNDQGYWTILARAQPEQLKALATSVAAQYTSSDNGYLRDALLKQFQTDQQIQLGMSSGDPNADYQAKIAFAADYVAQRTTAGAPVAPRQVNPGNLIEFATRGGSLTKGEQQQQSWQAQLVGFSEFPTAVMSAIPFVGGDLAHAAGPRLPASIEQAWAGLSVDQRKAYLGRGQAEMAVGNVVLWLPVLSGMGAVEAMAARSTGVAKTAFGAYNAVRNIAAGTMAIGVVSLTASSIAENAAPGYLSDIAKRIDYARPWSESPLAGLVNQVGFFSSGTFGAYGAARLGGKVLSPVAKAILGVREAPMYADALGGSAVTSELAQTGLDAGILTAAPRSTFHSALENVQQAARRQFWEGALRGEPTGDIRIDGMTPEQKLVEANADLSRNAFGGESTGLLAKAMTFVQSARPFSGGEAQSAWDVAKSISDITHQQVRDYMMNRYGADYMARRAGATTADALEAEARATVTRLGGNAAMLGKHNEDGWAQVIRQLDGYEYMKTNGELHAAIEGPPVSEEGQRLMVMRSDHLFAGDADRIGAVIDGADPAAAQAAVAAAIRTHPEAAEWFAEWTPKAGVAKTPENVPPSVFKDWLDEVRPARPTRRALADPAGPTAGEAVNSLHAKMEGDGHYTLGYKPTDADGNFVSYVRRANGMTFKSPWLDYSLNNVESVDLGARRLLGQKLDAVFRGVRTRQILEYQKGLLFRRLTNRFDISAEQIDRFHAGVLKIATEYHYQPQTVGNLARASGMLGGIGIGVRKEVEALAEDVFGKGPLALKAGGTMDVNWPDEIAKSYRQSLKLNVTAGVTSFIKANFGPVGDAIAWASDPLYLTWRFNLSPLFKGGELAESPIYNWMLGVNGVDADARALYQHLGVGNDFAAIQQERPLDPMIASMSSRLNLAEASTAAGRQAKTYAFYARQTPQDLEARVNAARTQGQAAQFVEDHGGGGNLMSPEWLPRSPAPDAPVVLRDSLPPDFSTELGDVRPDLLSADELASEQGIWHATTAMTKVMNEGLKAGRQLKASDAIPALPREGEAFGDWRARLHADLAAGKPVPPDLMAPKPIYTSAELNAAVEPNRAIEEWPYYVHVNDAELGGALQNGLHATGPGGSSPTMTKGFALATDPDAMTGAKGGAILELDPQQMSHVRVDKSAAAGHVATTVEPDAINRVWKWDETKGDFVLSHESAFATTARPTGLGGSSGTNIHATYRYDLASEVAKRLSFSGQAARDEVDNGAILDHFAEWYGDNYHEMGRLLGAPISVLDRIGQNGEDIQPLLDWMERDGGYVTGRRKFDAVVQLDQSLTEFHNQAEAGEFTGAVGLVGGWEAATRIDPNEVGVVQLAFRKGSHVGDGVDQYEVELKPGDVKVIDDRPNLAPLASDKEGLLAQLNETLATEPKTGQLSVADYMVGGNGIAPGLEQRARQILTKLQHLDEAKLDGGPTFSWDSITPIEKIGLETRLTDLGWKPLPEAISDAYASGKTDAGQALNRLAGGTAESGGAVRAEGAAPPTDLYGRVNLDGSAEVKPIGQLYDEFQRGIGNAVDLEHTAGTSEALFDNIAPREIAAAKASGLWDRLKNSEGFKNFVNPVPSKMGREADLEIYLLRQRFPALLSLSGNRGVREVLQGLKVPENRWLDWLVTDRVLERGWISGAPDAEAKLLEHVGGDLGKRAAMDAFNTSEEWDAISTLIRQHIASAQQEAFGVHFFQAYRSPLERSLNHPLLGLYPISWSLKAAKQWAKFLYDNETLGIKVGMAPAQAIASLVHSQNAALAQAGFDTDPNSKTNPLGISGPWGAPLLMFNLLMPGDWSSIPFPASRTIRDYGRALLQNKALPSPADELITNLGKIGVTRDARLIQETAGDLIGLVAGPHSKVKPQHAATVYSYRDGIVPTTYEEPLR